MITPQRQTSADRTCVVIPAFGPTPHLTDILQALNRGTSLPARVVISHSGPWDPDAIRVPDSLSVTFLHTDSRLFAGAARNRGAAQASEDILVFCDSDVLPARDWLRQIVAEMESRPDQFVVGSVGMARTGGYWGTANWLCEFSEQAPWRQPREQSGGASCNLAVRKSDFDRIGGFPEEVRIGQDTVFFHSLRRLGLKQWFAPSAIVGHFNRTGLRNMARHQWMHGRAFICLRREIDLTGHTLVRSRWLTPLLPVAKTLLILGRMCQDRPANWLRHLWFAPGVAAGMLCWGAGVLAETFSAPRRAADAEERH